MINVNWRLFCFVLFTWTATTLHVDSGLSSKGHCFQVAYRRITDVDYSMVAWGFFPCFLWVWDLNLFKRLPRAVAHLLIFFVVMLTQATNTNARLEREWTTRAAMNVLGHFVVLLCWHEAPLCNELPESHSTLRVSINRYWFYSFIKDSLVASLEALCALNGAQCALLSFIWPILGNFYTTLTVPGFPIEPRSTHRWLGDKLGPVTSPRSKLRIANMYVWESTWNLQNERNAESPGSRNC